MFVLGGLGPPEYEITNLEDPPPDFSFMVPAESLLVTSGADDDRLTSLLEQVDHVLLSLRSSVSVEGLYSWGAMIKVEGQHCFSSIGQEERCEPRGSVRGRSQALEDRWDLCNPSHVILIESVKDAGLESLEDHAIGPLDLTVSTWMSDRGPVDPDAVSITKV